MLPDLPGLDYRFILTILKLFIFIQTTSSAGSNRHMDFRDRYPIPRFLPTQTNVTRSVGEIAILNCSIKNLGTRTVVWRRVDEISPLTIGTYTYAKDNSIIVEHKPETPDWNLKIINVTVEHAGGYECQVSTKSKNFRKNFYLTVKERSLKPTEDLKQEIHLYGPDHVEKGQKLTLSCNATGVDVPPEDLDWFKNGYKIVTNVDEGVFMSMTVRLSTKTIASTLHIARAKMEDSGIYTCRTSDLQVLSTNVQVLTADSDQHKRVSFSGGKSKSKDAQSVTEKSEGINKSNMLITNVKFLSVLLIIYHIIQRTFFE